MAGLAIMIPSTSRTAPLPCGPGYPRQLPSPPADQGKSPTAGVIGLSAAVTGPIPFL